MITLADTVGVMWTAETKRNQIVTENPNKVTDLEKDLTSLSKVCFIFFFFPMPKSKKEVRIGQIHWPQYPEGGIILLNTSLCRKMHESDY